MEPLLFLTHRIPYPPNKGDKITNYEMLRYLSKRYEIHLGTFIDDPRDLAHREKVLEFCASAHFEELSPTVSRLISVRALIGQGSLTLAYYPRRNLQRWCNQVVRDNRIKRAFVSSTPMYQFAQGIENLRSRVIHFHDLDSDKWRQYAESKPWPLSALYRRESRTLLEEERSIAIHADAGFFVTPSEADLFRTLAPESADKIHWPGHGLDHAYYSPNEAVGSPYKSSERVVLFVGVMDYWPNEDAAIWFAKEGFPFVQALHPGARFYIVGLNPTPRVKALALQPNVVVTGEVHDVRPYLQHAAVIIAPLRIARGIQNKALQGMAMERAVVMSPICAESLSAVPGSEIEVAGSGREFGEKISSLLAESERASAMGKRARRRVLNDYSWDDTMKRMETFLEGAASPDLHSTLPVTGHSLVAEQARA